jgi:phenylacetate-CoA ligase
MWKPEIEFQPLEVIKKFQEVQLQHSLKYLQSNSPYYSRVFSENSIDLAKIRSIEDLALLPITTKDDLQQYNEEFYCVPRNKIIDYVTTSGTLGDPVTFVLTDKDIERLAYNEYLSFITASCTSEDIFQLMTTIDRRFMAGLAYFLGAKKLGAGVVRVGSGIPELQYDTIKRISPTVLIAVPSFILKMIEYAEHHGIDYKNSSIKKAICIGEPLRNEDFTLNNLGRKINEKWDIKLYSTYASTEMATSFTECDHGQGGHLNPELVIAEFLDENNQHVKEGEAGEVTITTLQTEGMPLLRFKTGDICHFYTTPCACGRTTLRIGPVIGRKNQMIKYKGTTLYPPALYDLLNDIPGVENYIIEINTNEIGTDEILIRVGSKNPSEELEKELKDHFRAKLRVAPTIKFEKIDVIQKLQFPETNRKPTIFFDKRRGF